jgi:hypothetical protein
MYAVMVSTQCMRTVQSLTLGHSTNLLHTVLALCSAHTGMASSAN